jgi:glyoxylate/hydroxypyruvate reductase A
MNILLSGEFDAAELRDWHHWLGAALPEARWLDRAQALAVADTVQVAVVANPRPGSLLGLPRLRLIQSLWAGVERLLRDPTLPPGVPIARMVDPAMNASMAETALWATLALHRGGFDYARDQQQRRWQPRPSRRADQLQVLVLGLGQMGRTAAERIAQQGYRVSGWRLRPAAQPGALPGVEDHAGAAALPALLARADIVINLLPLTPATTGVLDARLFAAMPRGASIVNLARGAHLVDADLLAALASGQIAHAVLDVFHTEPLPDDHAFWSHPQVTVLPHVAGQTDAASASQVVAANVRALLEGRALQHLVERERGY